MTYLTNLRKTEIFRWRVPLRKLYKPGFKPSLNYKKKGNIKECYSRKQVPPSIHCNVLFPGFSLTRVIAILRHKQIQTCPKFIELNCTNANFHCYYVSIFHFTQIQTNLPTQLLPKLAELNCLDENFHCSPTLISRQTEIIKATISLHKFNQQSNALQCNAIAMQCNAIAALP